MKAIIKRTATGKRAFPIELEDAEALVAEGKAINHGNGLYEAVATQSYGTKDMRAKRDMPKPQTKEDTAPKDDLNDLTVLELREVAKERGIKHAGLKKAELLEALADG